MAWPTLSLDMQDHAFRPDLPSGAVRYQSIESVRERMALIVTWQASVRSPTDPGAFSASCRRRGFTLIELLVVIGIIGVLMGLVLSLWTTVTADRQTSTTSALVKAMAAAISTYRGGNTLVSYPWNGVEKTRRLWDFDADGLVDGDPARSFPAGVQSEAAAAGYSGPLSMLDIALSGDLVDKTTRAPLDGWRRRIHIGFGASWSGGFGLWSSGRDGVDNQGDGDDITSWKH